MVRVRNYHQRVHFETPVMRKEHLGGGATYWWNLGNRSSLGYREGVWSSAWYARFGWAKNKNVSMRFAEPDDDTKADGVVVLSFEQAILKAKVICEEMARSPSSFFAPQGKYRELPVLPPHPPYLVAHALMDYRERQIERGKRIDPDESLMRKSILPHLGHLEVEKITTKDIRDWVQTLLSVPASLASRRSSLLHFRRLTHDDDCRDRRKGAANSALRVLKASLQLAYENEICDSDSAWRRVKNLPRNPRKPPRFLERDEIHRLVSECPDDLRKLVIAALVTGCRANELEKLRVKDYLVDLRRLIVKDDKTKKTRHVTMSREGKEFFDRVTAGRDTQELIFTRADGSAWRNCNYLYRLHRACNRVDIKPVVGLHDLRRTFASHAVMGGVPLPVLSKQLGHSRVEITERSYLHLSVTYMDDVFMKNMPDLVSGDKPWHLDN